MLNREARHHHGPAAASPGEVAAFVSRAEKGFAGRFLFRYAVQYERARETTTRAQDVVVAVARADLGVR